MTKKITIGVVGAGQLGRMLALAGIPMGYTFEFLDQNTWAPAAALGEFHIGAFTDEEAIVELAKRVDVLTFDVENVPASCLTRAAEYTQVWPSSDALQTAQDRLREKTLFKKLHIPIAQFVPVASLKELQAAIIKIGFPAVLKTRRLGYDGRGQRFIRQQSEVQSAWQELQSDELILEQFIHFERELSIIVARNANGQSVSYPLTENAHKQGILHLSSAPYNNDQLAAKANEYAAAICAHFDYVGVLTVELFLAGDQLFVNEIAPRVHNSGHWTIEGAHTSQFENHIRAILNLPLGNTAARGYASMVNFLGVVPDQEACLKIDNLHFHDYGKSPRPSRKVGHATIVSETQALRDKRLAELTQLYQADL